MRKDDSRAYPFSFPYPFIGTMFCLVLVCRFFAQDAPDISESPGPSEQCAFG